MCPFLNNRYFCPVLNIFYGVIMKFVFRNILFAFSMLLNPIVYSQDIVVIDYEGFKYQALGTFEIVLNFKVVNQSSLEQTVFEVRTLDSLPDNWASSMCFGALCFSPDIDSVATTDEFLTDPLQPGDTLETSLHVFTDMVSIATAYVQIQVGTFHNPDDRIILNFIVTTDPTLDVEENIQVNNYSLSQNYPNPFNPSTKVNYNIGEAGFVQLKVYNILGVEVSTLVNEYKNAGNHSIEFNAAKFSSGVYLYQLSVNKFTQTRKMILEK